MPAQWTGRLVGEIHNAGLTIKQVAAEAGLNNKYVSQVLNADTESPKAEQKLRAALMDCLELLGRTRDEPQSTTRLYTYDDLAQMLGKSKSTVREWVRAGKFGEPVTVGSSTRVTQVGLDKFIADHSGPMKKQPSKARTRTSRTAATHQGQPLGI